MGAKRRKPRNLKKVEVFDDGSLHGLNPYVNYDADMLPIRVTLDGVFGIEDLIWIIDKINNTQ